MPHQTSVKSAGERVEDAMREIGTLLIAFAPLDAALSERREHVAVFLLLFLGLGALLFIGALVLERRRSRAE
jgi:hypothetical protein